MLHREHEIVSLPIDGVGFTQSLLFCSNDDSICRVWSRKTGSSAEYWK